jgi:hypothetical protein
MDDKQMREALQRKLSDPQWKAEQDRRYRQIVGDAPTPARQSGRFDIAPPRLETIRFAPAPPIEPEADTIEALWNGNWQRSAGALTITRFPDDTVALDHPDGARTVFRPCPAPRSRHSWMCDTVNGAGWPIESYRCPDRYEDAAEALLEMHRAALAMFAELRSETEA